MQVWCGLDRCGGRGRRERAPAQPYRRVAAGVDGRAGAQQAPACEGLMGQVNA